MTCDLPYYRDGDRLGELAENPDQWTAQDYLLCDKLYTEDNVEAEGLVRQVLCDRDPALAARVRFTSETGCFFAHTDTLADMQTLAALVSDLVDARSRP